LQLALISSAHTSGNSPPAAPAAPKIIIASHSRRAAAMLRLPATRNAAAISSPATRSARCIADANGWPVTSILLNSSSGDRISPGRSGTRIHQL
jgi:hypothetical protein